jgi:hypothetical protein
MRRLSRNYWRLGWVLLINGAMVILQLTAPIRLYNDQQALHQVIRTAAPAFSYWKELFVDPWVPALAVTLLAGILGELLGSVLSPILNLAPFIFWLILIFRNPSSGEQALLIFPLVMIIAADVVFYALAFRRR